MLRTAMECSTEDKVHNLFVSESTNPNKVALFIPSLAGGGAERVMLNLARGFAAQGIEVDLVLAKAEGPYLAEVPPQINIVDLKAKRVLTSLPNLIRYLRKEQPAVLLSALEHANVIALWARKLSNVHTRVVISVHVTLSQDSSNAPTIRGRFFAPVAIKKFYPWADTVVVVSKAAQQDLLLTTKLDPERVRVILNPVISPDLFEKTKTRPEHPWFEPGQPPVILGVGRLTQAKDFPTLIKAFALVRKQRTARLMILGEGEDRSKLEKLISDLELQDDVCLPGFVNNPYAYMAHASVFVLSSVFEGLPTVLIESLAIGTPVVATDCPSGPREILQDGRYGPLVPVGNAQAIAEGVLACLQQTRSENSQEDAWAPFELNKIVQQYIDAFSNRQAPGPL